MGQVAAAYLSLVGVSVIVGGVVAEDVDTAREIEPSWEVGVLVVACDVERGLELGASVLPVIPSCRGFRMQPGASCWGWVVDDGVELKGC